MKRFTMCISLLALAIFVAGCTQQGGTAKKNGTTGKPADTTHAEKSTTPAAHTMMKPVIPAAGSGPSADAKKPEVGKPEVGKPEVGKSTGAASASATTETPTEKK